MSDFAPKILKYDLLSAADATIQQIGMLQVCGDYVWSLSYCITGSLPTDTYKISMEYSNDGIKWDLFSCCSEINNENSGAFFYSSLPFLNIRINYEPVVMQAGATIDALLILKVK